MPITKIALDFVEQHVYIPLCLDKLKPVQINDLSKAGAKKSNYKKINGFFDSTTSITQLQKNQVQIGTVFLESMDSHVMPSPEKKIPLCVVDTAQSLQGKVNRSIADLSTLYYELYVNGGADGNGVFIQRCRMTQNISTYLQEVLDLSYESGYKHANVSGIDTITRIVGEPSSVKTLSFVTNGGRKMKDVDAGFTRCVKFKVEHEVDRPSKFHDLFCQASEQYRKLGQEIQKMVRSRILCLILPESSDAKDDDITQSILQAVSSTFEVGFHVGFQQSQTKYKSRYGLVTNKWIYSCATRVEEDSIYIRAAGGQMASGNPCNLEVGVSPRDSVCVEQHIPAPQSPRRLPQPRNLFDERPSKVARMITQDDKE